MLRAARIEAVLWTVAFFCGGYLLFLDGQSQVFHDRATHFTQEGPIKARAESGQVIGRVDIPGIQLSVAVLEDDGSKSLLRGLGHVRGTAELGGLGTVGLAGHRDTFLRPLRNIKPGMVIRATNATGKYRYVVDSTEVVMPQAVDVIAIHSRPEMTLITCYPFNYIGAAPQRFVVHAHLMSVSPDTNG
jgi:sortase A